VDFEDSEIVDPEVEGVPEFDEDEFRKWDIDEENVSRY
jgi:hypothetical protein